MLHIVQLQTAEVEPWTLRTSMDTLMWYETSMDKALNYTSCFEEVHIHNEHASTSKPTLKLLYEMSYWHSGI